MWLAICKVASDISILIPKSDQLFSEIETVCFANLLIVHYGACSVLTTEEGKLSTKANYLYYHATGTPSIGATQLSMVLLMANIIPNATLITRGTPFLNIT